MTRIFWVALLLVACSTPPTEKLVSFDTVMPHACEFPGLELPEDAVVLAAGGYEGRKLDFQIDQSGSAATQIDIAVNYTDKPVVLMLGAYEPTIWNVGWSTGTRIVAVLANGYGTQRIAGLESGTPTLLSSNEEHGPCQVGYFGHDKVEAVEDSLARKLFSRTISSFTKVVDGKVVVGNPITPGVHLITSDHTRPAAFRDKAAPLAGAAGLDEALRKGILRRATLKDAEAWIDVLKKKYELQNLQPPDIPPDLNNAYVVLKQFTYPAGLYGGHSATFYIAQGVPLPTGNYGHSRVYDLNSISLECTAGGACGRAIMNGTIGAGSTRQGMSIGNSKY